MSGRTIALLLFAALVLAGLILTYLAGRRSRTAGEFWAAGGGISPTRNAIATLGDLMSGSALLGGIGLMFLVGYDSLLYLVLPLLAWIPVMLLVAERLRNLGEYTLTDVLVRRFRSGSLRTVLAVSTLAISGLTFLSGPQWGDLDGALVVCALKAQQLLVMRLAPDGSVASVVSPQALDGEFGRLRAARQGPDGALYVTTDNGDDDQVLRVTRQV